MVLLLLVVVVVLLLLVVVVVLLVLLLLLPLLLWEEARTCWWLRGTIPGRFGKEASVFLEGGDVTGWSVTPSHRGPCLGFGRRLAPLNNLLKEVVWGFADFVRCLGVLVLCELDSGLLCECLVTFRAVGWGVWGWKARAV